MDIFQDKRNEFKSLLNKKIKGEFLSRKITGTLVSLREDDIRFYLTIQLDEKIENEDEIYYYADVYYYKNDGSGSANLIKPLVDEPITHSAYLGDGVYADFNGFQVTLSVNHHKNIVIYLEEEVAGNLVNFLKNKFK